MSSDTENGLTFVQQPREDYQDEGKFKRRVTVKSILCNKTVKGWIFLTIFAASVPILVYYFVIDQATYYDDDSYSCLVDETFRVPCGKVNISRSDCRNIQCCYDRSTKMCYHYLPSRYSYDMHESSGEYIAVRDKTPFNTASVRQLKVTVNEIDENKVSVILSEEKNVEDHYLETEKNYKVNVVEEILMVQIFRSNDDLLLTTAKGPLIASDTYWEWSLYMTNHSLFGLNQTLIDVPENTTFSRVIYKNEMDHSSLPVLWAYNNKNFHGVVIKHDGPLQITILPSNLVILRSLTGGSIELELSVGPTPKLLHDQQAQLAAVPPLWTLQTYTCRRGSNTNLTELLADYNLDNQTASDCIHENLVMGIMKDNNTNMDNVRAAVKSIKEQGSRFLLSVPPHVLQDYSDFYNKLVALDIFYKYNNSVYTGKYLDEMVAYPDYESAQTQTFLTEFSNLLSKYMDIADIDGFVLHDNWPAHDNYSMNSTQFPYLPQDLREAMSNTLPWNSTTSDGTTLHITNHNAYGTSQMTSFQSFFNNIPIVMSASMTLDRVETPMIQNVNASWTDLLTQIDNVLFKSVFGNHLVSLPVCGDTTFFSSSLQETLCLRWYLVAATMPMFKMSSFEPRRDPAHLESVFAQSTASSAIALRNMLLPYYYTILNRNEPVIRPMFYDYYENETTFSLNNQYMIGEGVLVAHPFSAGRNRLQVYLPNVVGIWYELWGGQLYNSTDEQLMSFDIIETDFIAFIAQGTILPMMDENNLNIIVALNCSATPCEATGTLFTSSSITFQSTESALTISDIPKENCVYTVASVNVYNYDKNNDKRHISTDEDLCTGESSITISYLSSL